MWKYFLKNKSILEKIFCIFPKRQIITVDGFDNAVIGFKEVEIEGKKHIKLIYSMHKCIEILMEDGLGYYEAIEYLDFNTIHANVGDGTLIWDYSEES